MRQARSRAAENQSPARKPPRWASPGEHAGEGKKKATLSPTRAWARLTIGRVEVPRALSQRQSQRVQTPRKAPEGSAGALCSRLARLRDAHSAPVSNRSLAAFRIRFGALLEQDRVIVAASCGTIALHVIGAALLLWRRMRLAVSMVYPCSTANAYFFKLAGGMTLRHLAFPTEVRWLGDGHRFAWRMLMYDRDAYGHVVVTTPDGARWIARPEDFLTERLDRATLTRSDTIWQFARHLKTVCEVGLPEVAALSQVEKSLNGRPHLAFVEPTVDLFETRNDPLGPNARVLTLVTPFPRPGT